MVKVTIELTRYEQDHIEQHEFWDACETVNKIMYKVQNAARGCKRLQEAAERRKRSKNAK